MQPDGKMVVGGDFPSLAGLPCASLARLNSDGTFDAGFNPVVGGDGFAVVYALAVQPDGKILVGGDFTTLGGKPRTSLGRLNADGTVDDSFVPQVGGDIPIVYALALQSDGKIIVSGGFTMLAGQTRNYIGRLNTNGTLDTGFNPNADWFVGALALQADGKIVIGGAFGTVGGQPRASIARLSATGSLDTAFNPGISGDIDASVFCLAVQADGKILVGGDYTALGGQSRDNLGRLNTNGTLDTFNPGASGAVMTLAVQTDGKILVGGDFTTLAGGARARFGRLLTDGFLDATLDAGVNGIAIDFPAVLALALQTDGRILLGGSFTNVAGGNRANLARLNNPDAATRSLNYAGATITWLRGGGSAEAVWTTFEHGSNGVAWTSLGAGVRTNGGWVKTSASVPAGRTIRARGLIASSGINAWMAESYLGKPLFISQPVNRTNNFGTTATFEVNGAGTEPLSVRWFRNGVPLTDQGNVSGATTRILTLSLVANADEASYTAVVTNVSGSITSSVATLTVNDPFITQSPVGAARSVGGNVTFSVTAIGTPTLNYQWQRNGAPVAGATNTSLSLSNLTGGDAGTYAVVVSNAGGSVSSTPVVLTVNSITGDTTFNPSFNAAVFALAAQPDGKVVVGGAFTSANGLTRNRLARLNPDGSLDSAFTPSADGTVYGLAVQPDGKILVGGDFISIDGVTRGRIARLNSSGTLDTNFNPVAVSFFDLFTVVECLALQADGKILIGGVFDTVAGSERINIARLNTTGTADSFNPGLSIYANSQPFYSLAVQPDGKILCGGLFEELGGQPRTNIGRVTSSGSLDTAFNPAVDGPVHSFALQADGKILVGGAFTSLGGVARANIGRLNTNGTIDATFNPTASGQVSTIAVQADGKILVGGAFTSLGGQTRNRIARLLPDGTLDGSFNPGANSSVHALAVQPDGRILAGGNFSSLGSQTHLCLGRLHNNGAATQALAYAGTTITWSRGGTVPEVGRSTFDHSADGVTWTSIGAGTRITNGWQRTGFSLPAGRTIRARGDVAAGYHTASGWATESYYGKPVIVTQPSNQTNGGTTTAFFRVAVGGSEPIAIQWQKNSTNLVNQGNVTGVTSNLLMLANVLRADEGAYRVVASNSFGSVTSQVATLTVVNPAIGTHPVDTYRSLGGTATLTITAQGTPPLTYQWYRNGVAVPGGTGASLNLLNLSLADAGQYTAVVSNSDGSATSLPALLTVNGATTDTAFNQEVGSGFYDYVNATVVQADGRIVVGGDFLDLASQARDRIARINADGTLDDGFNPGADAPPVGEQSEFPTVDTMAMLPDGKIMVGGLFTLIDGQSRNHLGRLNPNGTLDSSFTAGVTRSEGVSPYVNTLALQSDGKIIIGGYFANLAGTSRNNFGRLNTNGTFDTGFSASANDEVLSLAIQPDGKVLAGGFFTTLAGSSRSYLGRVNATGSSDTTFNPGANGYVYALAVQPDGKILVGGEFTTLGGQARNYIGRLNTNGTIDTAFNPGASSTVKSIVLQADGKILVGGTFTRMGGLLRSFLARLHPDGTVDLTFNPGATSPGGGYLTIQPDGKILRGGSASYTITRMHNTEPATQNLSHSGTTLTWARGGTSPEVWRTTFERSTDGVSWTSLGAGLRIPGGWQLSGVSLATNHLVRARGYASGGFQNGSGWFTESLLIPGASIRANLVRNGNSLLLTWTGAQPPYQVQQSTNLANPNAWQNVGTPVQTNSMTLPISAGYQFLRVRTQ